MIPACATGSGEPPRFIKSIHRRSSGGIIRLAGQGISPEECIECSSDEALIACCREFAEQRYLFSMDREWGPAEIMSLWQEQGLMPLSFLKIAWRSPHNWVVHEIIPKALQWEFRSLSEILSDQPLQWNDNPAE